MPRKYVVVGGGIAGLTVAYTLQKESDASIILLESERFGGKIRTDTHGPLLIEHGPDSVFTAKPAALELIAELGLEHEIIEPQQSGFSILSNGRLHSVPRPLVSLMSIGSAALEKVSFLSGAAKRRVLSEANVPQGAGDDESIASFFRRRFGKRFAMTVAEPMLAGIHAGDPERLSMAALYPMYLGLEQKFGSLAGTQKPELEGKYSGRKPGFISLRSGLESIPRSLAQRLNRVELRTGVSAESIAVRQGHLEVCCNKTESIRADGVILATPPSASSMLLEGVAGEASIKLGRIRSASTAVATLAYKRADFPHEPSGNGFLVPTDEPCAITGCTWTSNKWERRAPDDVLLMRAFLGRDGALDVMAHSDETLLEMAESVLASVLQPRNGPTFRTLRRWPNAMPQYELGHLELMNQIEKQLVGLPIRLAGAGYRGSGIPDCIRQGKEAAHSLLASSTVMNR